MRISLHVELHIGGDDEPEEQQRDTALDALVEHGDNYSTVPELHIGFRGDD